MWFFNVPQEVRHHRLTTCHSCKHFRKDTVSCGTKYFGKRLTQDEKDEADAANLVTMNKKKFRLCGCDMDEKTRYTFFSCPLGKWHRHKLSDDEYKELKVFIETLPVTGVYTREHVAMAKEWFEKMTGRRAKNCSSCIRDIINEFKRQLEQAKQPNQQ